MSLPRRISAGGFIFKEDAILLVRYREGGSLNGTYLVAPGGGVEDDENVVQAIIREIKEETGIMVRPQRVIAIEDLVDIRVKCIKVWMTCELVEGEVRPTEEADREGIIDAGWFTRDQLAGEVVFPSILMEHDWQEFQSSTWQVECLPSRKARFYL
jgi:8-oxo-dGTP diphosphatase